MKCVEVLHSFADNIKNIYRKKSCYCQERLHLTNCLQFQMQLYSSTCPLWQYFTNMQFIGGCCFKTTISSIFWSFVWGYRKLATMYQKVFSFIEMLFYYFGWLGEFVIHIGKIYIDRHTKLLPIFNGFKSRSDFNKCFRCYLDFSWMFNKFLCNRCHFG